MSCTGCTFNNSTGAAVIDSYGWLDELPDTADKSDIVEVRFKTTRKEYFSNSEGIPLKRGDTIVVATSPGHDIGVVTLTGYLAEKQFQRKVRNPSRYKLNPVYRKASANDLDILSQAREREKPTMISARQIVNELGLEMKIGDVEFRGDNKKAIFYYIADGRVDFRELIKRYSREFGIGIEMKQIGTRQEAGIVGGIGSCGRELCCSSWLTNFKSIATTAAVRQGLSPSALKLAGACGKLKCCLLYELDAYVEAQNDFPEELLNLELSNGIAKPFKTDYLKKEIWYMLEGIGNTAINLTVGQVKDTIQKNKRGIYPQLSSIAEPNREENKMEVKLEGKIDRFDKNRKNFNRKRKSKFKGKNLSNPV